jgi:hypothetical protein
MSLCSFSKPDARISTRTLSASVPSAILPLAPLLTMLVAMPGTFGKNFFQPDYEWGFMTVGTRFSHGDALLMQFPRSPYLRSLKSTAVIQHSIGHGIHSLLLVVPWVVIVVL